MLSTISNRKEWIESFAEKELSFAVMKCGAYISQIVRAAGYSLKCIIVCQGLLKLFYQRNWMTSCFWFWRAQRFLISWFYAVSFFRFFQKFMKWKDFSKESVPIGEVRRMAESVFHSTSPRATFGSIWEWKKIQQNALQFLPGTIQSISLFTDFNSWRFARSCSRIFVLVSGSLPCQSLLDFIFVGSPRIYWSNMLILWDIFQNSKLCFSQHASFFIHISSLRYVTWSNLDVWYFFLGHCCCLVFFW